MVNIPQDKEVTDFYLTDAPGKIGILLEIGVNIDIYFLLFFFQLFIQEIKMG